VELLLVAAAAFAASALTLVTGFGLATLLTPVFVLFLPVPVAIAAVAIVHLANNLFKLLLVGRDADRRIALRFGVPAAIAAVAGAVVLVALADAPAVLTYELFGRREVSLLKLVVGLVIVAVAGVELRRPSAQGVRASDRDLLVGGLASGLIGGLTGNQGPLRAAVLLRSGLRPAAYIGTSAICAVFVDLGRLVVYGSTFASLPELAANPVVVRVLLVGSLSAFAGAVLAARLSKRATSDVIRWLTAGLLIVVGLALATGFV